MLEDLDAYVRRQYASTEEADKAIQRLGKLEDEVYLNINAIQEAQRLANSPEVVDEKIFDALDKTLRQASNTLRNEIVTASEVTGEYAHSQLLNPLLEAADYASNFSTTFIGTGWNTTISVTVDMDESAGNIEQWAQAVEATRLELGFVEKNSAQASNYWANIVYGGRDATMYIDTINSRLRNTNAKAPYWELLDKGFIGMSSDWGGTPHPQLVRTNFTGKAAQRIEKTFSYILKGYYTNHYREVDRLGNELYELEKYLKQITDTVKFLENLDFEKFDELVDYYGDRLDPNKLREAANMALTGIGNIKITKEGRVELTRPGGKRTRISYKKFQRIVRGE